MHRYFFNIWWGTFWLFVGDCHAQMKISEYVGGFNQVRLPVVWLKHQATLRQVWSASHCWWVWAVPMPWHRTQGCRRYRWRPLVRSLVSWRSWKKGCFDWDSADYQLEKISEGFGVMVLACFSKTLTIYVDLPFFLFWMVILHSHVYWRYLWLKKIVM